VVTGEAALQFPADYPVKIVGRPADDFRARVHAIMLRHAPELDAGEITERLSANGNFLSISYPLRATSRAQIEALVAQLKACDVLILL
jgi:putative lipoic acid-binding regulatory protein